ncbi:MAG: trypsin-like peptidase domain-containing protein [Elusimicrobiaceae bacterium]|nr:trypsin-like peptidase domain-containing protein [Elusimicrobiaceae bacterium]
MKKSPFLFLFFLCASGILYAQEEPVKVREDNFLAQKEISVWRTDKTEDSLVPVYSCQAIRISPKWFLTSAHCVYPACKGSLPCTVQVTLAKGELSQTVRIFHSTSAQRVFIYEGFFPGQNRISSVDVALIKFDPTRAQYSYAAIGQDGSWHTITQQEFNKLLPYSPETKAQLNAAGVRLVGAANLSTSRFLPQLAVPRMTEGSLSYLVSPSRDVFFVQELQHFISPGFGVRRGNSGGGVFTTQGDLVGLVSSLVYNPDGSAAFKNDEGRTIVTLQNANDLFFFTGFNGSTLNFIRNHVDGLRVIGADNGFVAPTQKKFSSIIKIVSGLPMKFE